MQISFIKQDKRAVTPTKAHPSDIGYDITVIDVYKTLTDDTIIYETGIAFQPPPGHYLEIVPRSSITKTQLMLANSVGIIDPHYTGTLKIAVRIVDKNLPELEMPFCKFQLILRKAIEANMVSVDRFEETERGDGCFGSSDKS